MLLADSGLIRQDLTMQQLVSGQWDNFATDCELLFRNIEKGLPVTEPGYIIAVPSSAEQQRHWSRSKC